MSLFSNITDGMSKLMGNAAHNIHLNNPRYRHMVIGLKKSVEPIAIVGLVAGCAAIVFGAIALGAGSFVALALTGLSVCVAYNSLVISANVAKIVEMPAKYFSAYGIGEGLDKPKLMEDLCGGTFGCTGILNGIVEGLDILKKEVY